jgi:hypothetical protein
LQACTILIEIGGVISAADVTLIKIKLTKSVLFIEQHVMVTLIAGSVQLSWSRDAASSLPVSSACGI